VEGLPEPNCGGERDRRNLFFLFFGSRASGFFVFKAGWLYIYIGVFFSLFGYIYIYIYIYIGSQK
jgi:hypothetical protein